MVSVAMVSAHRQIETHTNYIDGRIPNLVGRNHAPHLGFERFPGGRGKGGGPGIERPPPPPRAHGFLAGKKKIWKKKKKKNFKKKKKIRVRKMFTFRLPLVCKMGITNRRVQRGGIGQQWNSASTGSVVGASVTCWGRFAITIPINAFIDHL